MYFGTNSVQKCFKISKRTPKEEAPKELQQLKPRNSQATHVQSEETKFPIR